MNQKQDRDSMWMANLDHQVTPGEAMQFEQWLSESERERLAHELRLEALLMARLMEGPDCPDALLKQITKSVRVSSKRQPRFGRTFWLCNLAAAAMVVFIAGSQLLQFGQAMKGDVSTTDRISLALGTESPSDLAEESQTAPDRFAVERFLQEREIQLAISDFSAVPPASMHKVTLIGARVAGSAQDSLVELLYNCCGSPARVYVAKRDSGGAARILDAERNGELQEQAVVGDYVAGVAGTHASDHLLRVLQPLDAQRL